MKTGSFEGASLSLLGGNVEAAVQDPELFEREHELQTLDAMIAAACQGAGRFVVVKGAAGIGKTRLLAAARTQAQRTGMRVLAARGLQLEQAFAYGVVRQLFEPALASADPAQHHDLLAGAAAQAAVLFDQADPAVDGGDISCALLHGLYWLTANLAQRPLMLLIDDLHWADGPSLRFLAYLLPRLEGLPLLVTVGLRPAESAVDQNLLTHIITDPQALIMHPESLSKDASTRLVRAAFAEKADDAFCLACHAATGGNPLLLRELVNAAIIEGLDASAAGIARLYAIGPQAVKNRVALWLARLGPSAVAFCEALAVLGDGSHPAHIARLAALEPATALDTARQLVESDILHQGNFSCEAQSLDKVNFVHPLVRAAVYEALSETARLDRHVQAARLLAAAGEDPERVAAHLLRIPPAGNDFVVATLCRAADAVFARGSPESAVSYLERCLQEPPPVAERAQVLFQLGVAAQLIDAVKGADYLREAMTTEEDTRRKIAIAEILGGALFKAGRGTDAAEVLSHAIQLLGADDPDLSKRFRALLIHTSLIDPAQRRFSRPIINEARRTPPDSSLGSRMLDVTIAFRELLNGTSPKTAVTRAHRGLSDGMLIEQLNPLSVYGCCVLICADLDEVVPLLDTWITVAHRRGSLFALTPAICLRGRAWLSRGALAEAEQNLRDSWWAVMATSQAVSVPIVASYFADTLMELGNLDEADAVLKTASALEIPSGYWAWWLSSCARLLSLQGRTQQSLQTWMACGRRFAAQGGNNPAVLAWRSGAAMALHRLGRSQEAQELADKEITIARQWGAPTALGRALRVGGLISGGQHGLSLLLESTTILASSSARLEHAKSLLELGAALRRAGRRGESRQQLSFGVELAQTCGARPLVERGLTELQVNGVPRQDVIPSGPNALTPSERRVAELAAAGHSNRDIAQILFITTNTVEIHLTRAYRKLGIKRRSELSGSRSTFL